MARPRIINGDVVLTFNCPYVLKVGLIRAAVSAGQETPSSLIRHELENACRRILGDAQWDLLNSASEPPARLALAEEFVQTLDTKRLRAGLDSLSAERAVRANMAKIFIGEIDRYISDISIERDRADVSLPLCAALHEVTDILGKIKTSTGRHALTSEVVHELRLLTRRLPAELRAEMDAGILAVMSAGAEAAA
jgi:hypothetical protein